jgi:hypothetical protein
MEKGLVLTAVLILGATMLIGNFNSESLTANTIYTKTTTAQISQLEDRNSSIYIVTRLNNGHGALAVFNINNRIQMRSLRNAAAKEGCKFSAQISGWLNNGQPTHRIIKLGSIICPYS